MPKRIKPDELVEGLAFYARDLVDQEGGPLLIEIAKDAQDCPWLSVETCPGLWYALEEEVELPGGNRATAIDLMIDQYEPDPPFGYVVPMARWYMMRAGKTAPWLDD